MTVDKNAKVIQCLPPTIQVLLIDCFLLQMFCYIMVVSCLIPTNDVFIPTDSTTDIFFRIPVPFLPKFSVMANIKLQTCKKLSKENDKFKSSIDLCLIFFTSN